MIYAALWVASFLFLAMVGLYALVASACIARGLLSVLARGIFSFLGLLDDAIAVAVENLSRWTVGGVRWIVGIAAKIFRRRSVPSGKPSSPKPEEQWIETLRMVSKTERPKHPEINGPTTCKCGDEGCLGHEMVGNRVLSPGFTSEAAIKLCPNEVYVFLEPLTECLDDREMTAEEWSSHPGPFLHRWRPL
jgi:hypothetical protein